MDYKDVLMILLQGFLVFAGCLKKSQSEGVRELERLGRVTGRIATIQLNVTSDKEVQDAVQTAQERISGTSNVREELDRVQSINYNLLFDW